MSGQQDTNALTTRPEFAISVGPALALVAPTGMTQDERKTWLGAAHKALAHLDAATLARATAIAMLKADHPSKLVPAIAAEAERTGYKSMVTMGHVPVTPEPPETDAQRRDRLELAEMMRGLREKLEANVS